MNGCFHNDVIKCTHFPRHWPFVRGIHWWLMDSLQWPVFTLICAWTTGWAKNRDAGNFRRHRAQYDVTVMSHSKRTFAKLSVLIPLINKLYISVVTPHINTVSIVAAKHILVGPRGLQVTPSHVQKKLNTYKNRTETETVWLTDKMTNMIKNTGICRTDHTM